MPSTSHTGNKMKKFLSAIWNILKEIGRTRAAAAAARSGNFTKSHDLIK
jgi:hypothetical protein